MHILEHKIPPPLVAAAIAFAMWPLSSLLPKVAAPENARLAIAITVALIGIAFALAGAIAFRRAKTTVNPLHPEQTTALVVAGVYRISRNPMYAGMLLCLLAWAIYLASPLSLAGPLAFIFFINRFQIGPEEKILAEKFGEAFERYRASARRWL
jgi:protein-S-isoprenylcysteine O-methyltransferase Ste14